MHCADKRGVIFRGIKRKIVGEDIDDIRESACTESDK